MALWPLLGIDVAGWDRLRPAVVAHAHGPLLVFLDEGAVLGFALVVVVTAEKYAVRDGGFALVPPRDEVMGIAVAGCPVAAGEGAAAITNRERGSEGSAEQSLLSPDVEGLAGAVADDGQDVGVAREQAGVFGADLFAGLEQDGGFQSVGERTQVEEKVDAWSVTTVGGSVARAGVAADDVDQRVEATLVGGSQVTARGEVGAGAVGFRERLDERAEGLAVGDGCLAGEVHVAVSIGCEA